MYESGASAAMKYYQNFVSHIITGDGAAYEKLYFYDRNAFRGFERKMAESKENM